MSKFHFFYLLFILFLLFSCTKENEIRDSIISERLQYQKLNEKQKLKVLDSINSIFIPKVKDSFSNAFLFDISAEYYYLNAYEKSFDVCEKILELAKNNNDSLSIAKSYYYMGDCFEVTQKDSAYFFYHKAEKIYRLLNNKEMLGKMLFNKAYILFFEGNYTESEIELSKALFYLEKESNTELLFSCYNLMGCNFEKLKDYENAFKYYLLSKEQLVKLKKNSSDFDKKNNYSVTLSVNLANIYEKKGQYKKSLAELQSVLTNDLKKNWPSDYATVIGNIGYSKMKSKDYEGVENYLKEALIISQKHDNEGSIVYKLNNLGEYYLETKDTLKSIACLKKSLQLAEKINAGEEIKNILLLLSKADFKNEIRYKNRIIEVNENLMNLQRNNMNKYARIEYETSSIEDKNKLLTTENLYIFVVSFFLILLVFLLLIVWYLKNENLKIESRRQKQIVEEEIFELLKNHQIKITQTKEFEQNRISRELHDGIMNRIYGVRLQLGILNDSNDEIIKEKRLYYLDVLQEIEQEVRSISHDLSSESVFVNFDYKSLVYTLFEEQNEISTTHFVITIDDAIPWNTISGMIKVTIYRILQEIILNVNKHAQAKNCISTIELVNHKTLRLTIEDDGIGFDLKQIEKKGIGMKNLNDRVKLVNANFTIVSQQNEGTKLEVVFSI